MSAPPSCRRPGPARNDSAVRARRRRRRRHRRRANCRVRCHCSRRRGGPFRDRPLRAAPRSRRARRLGGRIATRTPASRRCRYPSQRQISLPSGSRITIHAPPCRHWLGTDPCCAERDPARRFRLDVVDDEIEMHAVLHGLRLGHLLEDDLGPGRVARPQTRDRCRPRRTVRIRAPRSRTPAARRRRRSRC